MNTRSDSPTSAPRPECDAIARQIPLLHTGALAPDATTAVEEHIYTCASCRSQRADLDHVETLLRRIYSPGASPFQPITFDEIQSRIEQQPRVGAAQYAGNSMHLLRSQPKNLPSARSKRSHERPAGRLLPMWLPRLTAVAAVITLVSLFALLFHAVAPKGTGTWAPISTVSPATATPIHYLGARARWEQSAQIHGDPQTPYMVYTISQADPRVMYRYQLV
ncbi:MAG: zf-HC2 domain-containing protein, partial [Ktedonobacterales bacterium]